MPPTPTEKVPFDWIDRCGVHYAYHQGPSNRALHAVLIPLQILGLLAVLTSLRIPYVINDFSVPVLLLLFLIYFRADKFLGGLFMLFLGLLRLVAIEFELGIVFGVVLFAGSLLLQTQVGHRFLEPQGRDDTKHNLAAFQASRDPIPLLLVYFYHFVVDGVCRLGLRQDVIRGMKGPMEAERKTDRFKRAKA